MNVFKTLLAVYRHRQYVCDLLKDIDGGCRTREINFITVARGIIFYDIAITKHAARRFFARSRTVHGGGGAPSPGCCDGVLSTDIAHTGLLGVTAKDSAIVEDGRGRSAVPCAPEGSC